MASPCLALELRKLVQRSSATRWIPKSRTEEFHFRDDGRVLGGRQTQGISSPSTVLRVRAGDFERDGREGSDENSEECEDSLRHSRSVALTLP